MQIFVEFFGGEVAAIVAAIIGGAILLSAILGYLFQSAGLYAAIALTWSGGASVFCISYGVAWRSLGVILALAACVGGIVYELLFFILVIRRKMRARKALRTEIGRKMQYALPQAGNGYIRARLNGSLSCDEEARGKNAPKVRLEYAKTMLAKIKEAGLSPVERLELEELSGAVSLYGKMDKWSGADVKALNEIFARLLKLSAKYEIAV